MPDNDWFPRIHDAVIVNCYYYFFLGIFIFGWGLLQPYGKKINSKKKKRLYFMLNSKWSGTSLKIIKISHVLPYVKYKLNLHCLILIALWVCWKCQNGILSMVVVWNIFFHYDEHITIFSTFNKKHRNPKQQIFQWTKPRIKSWALNIISRNPYRRSILLKIKLILELWPEFRTHKETSVSFITVWVFLKMKLFSD